ncbi:crotonobetainyl-CoA:carnitine CoA-transferase CaiB-like acyl-CoA transferase [Rhodococcus wratislaviensis]|uniref:CaiB/BaiF family protein n=1 Tax=Rhodococcus wratislaviensis TaxID=44752 RepID=A0AB38FCQ3_RHOWR|nr:CaiB/BaiF CoA-transferase family protein [Rhodococcus wratislaviensis]REE75562.1 crotonobetainyl-CoA:carnitine CoA-transferase CaiB-like acyl-CoA transferase [Rhodococcus wratislaviensis]SPZ39402.1 CaiB/BaiF family protein [Rhodococcus wratislaviensis]
MSTERSDFAPHPVHRPLEGVVVVSLEQAIAAPFATRQLADLGARVIKIERPGVGDLARGYDRTVQGMASHFVWTNRGKESIELDVRSEEGNRILHQLVDRADVLVQNLAPGAAGRLGIGAERLRDTHPNLITCDISGYGRGGPYEARKAYDLLIQCEAGLVSITGTEDEPSKVGLSIADICAGMYAYSGILTALLDRGRTGRGANLEISMLEALGEWMGYADYYARYGGSAPKRTGASHATIAPYGPFTAADGEVVNLGLQNEREWDVFCRVVLQAPELIDDPRFVTNADRVAHRADLDGVIGDVAAGLTGADLVDRLEAAKIAYARQRTMDEFAEHPQLVARSRWAQFDSPVGPLEGLLPPVTVMGAEHEMRPVPGLGEHTDSILTWLGEYAAVRS